MRFTKVLWPIIIVCSALVAVMAMSVFPGLPARPLFIMWFLFICPGMAFVRFLHLKELLVKLALAMAVSFSIDGIVVGIYLYAGHWSPLAMMLTLAVFSIAAVSIEFTNAHVMVYNRFAVLRSLGILLTHPLIVGTSSAKPGNRDDLDLVEEPTVRIVSMNSISNLLATATPMDIEEKPTIEMSTARPQPSSAPNWEDDIEEKPTIEMSMAQPSSATNWEDDIEEKPTIEMSTARPRPSSVPNWEEDIEEKPTIEMSMALPQPSSAANWEDDIEEKPTIEIGCIPSTSPPVQEEVDKTIQVVKSPWLQEQQTKPEDKPAEEDDIEKRATHHIANVAPPKQPDRDDLQPQKPSGENIGGNVQQSSQGEDAKPKNPPPALRKRSPVRFTRIEK
ncbi:acyltransferase [Dictyobacter arantiisoli]|uniref:Uncharacterized protein n=1 Tax=Dictyobacter arantiisoli TaxID=2014874 RepID=A0A5A5TFX2_9CHLR|nr:acyltransferase [Dictyobacter arantiisoli]GCF10148.1 hypothetical protein KDI_37120 [Dictyobacter arantiisoli]